MPVSTREMYLVLRARDEASRVVRNFAGEIDSLDRQTAEMARQQIRRGQAMATIGLGIAGAGVIGANALNTMTNAAAEYNTLAAQTLTQTDNLKTSVQELSDVGKRVAQDIPVPLNELQGALKFIFSSIDVNVSEAEDILRGFAKEAVTGQADIQAAARTSIALLNAYQLPVTELSRLQDIQFQIVRKGVLTYDELSNNIGKAIPAAARAGQSFETLGAMMSFMTRNGLNAAMASTSAARALETIAHPKVVKNLESIGVTVSDATGEFRPLVDILGEVNDKFSTMTGPERAEALQSLLVGGGNRIQARRFWDLVLKNFDDFRQHTEWMKNSQGVFDDAYDTMFKAPQSQVQLLTNQYEIMKVELGEALLPVKLQLVKAVTKLLKAFNNLSPATKELIAKAAALAAGLAVIIGAVVSAAGFFLIFKGAAVLAGVALGTVVSISAAVVAAIVAIIAIIVLVIKNWDTIKAVAITVWNAVRDAVVAAWEKIVEWTQRGIEVAKSVGNWFVQAGKAIANAWSEVWSVIGPVVMSIVDWVGRAGAAIRDWAVALFNEQLPKVQEAWDSLSETVGNAIQSIIEFMGPLISDIKDFISTVVDALVPRLIEGWDKIREGVQRAWEVLRPAFEGFGLAMEKLVNIIGIIVRFGWEKLLKPMLDELGKEFVVIFQGVLKAVEVAIKIIVALFKFLVEVGWNGILKPAIAILASLFGNAFSLIGTIVKEVVVFIAARLASLIEIIKAIISFVHAVLTGDWQAAWNAAKQIVSTIVQAIVGLVKGLFTAGVNIIKGLVSAVINFFKDLWKMLVGGSIVPDMINGITKWFRKLPGLILGGLASFVKAVINWFLDLGKGVTDKVRSGIRTVVSWFGGLPGRVLSSISSLPGRLYNFGKSAMRRLKSAVSNIWSGTIRPFIRSIPGKIVSALGSLGSLLYSAGKDLMRGLKNGITSMASNIASSAKSAASSAVSGVKNFLGIGSPSKVFQEIGLNTMQGLKLGVEQNVPNFVGLWQQLLQAFAQRPGVGPVVPGMARTGLTANLIRAGTGGGFPGAGDRQKVIEQNITINTEEIDPLKHAADLGWALAART